MKDALYLSCDYLYDYTGSCPCDQFIGMYEYIGCTAEKCEINSPVDCWKEYFFKKSAENILKVV